VHIFPFSGKKFGRQLSPLRRFDIKKSVTDSASKTLRCSDNLDEKQNPEGKQYQMQYCKPGAEIAQSV
jgi:hypothetical protein